MAKEFLKPIYHYVFGESFDGIRFESRMEMQKLVYILQEAGITVGDYNFLWYKHGPYSQELQNDILAIASIPEISLDYSSDAKSILDKVKELFRRTVNYKRCEWVECIASLQYLKSNMLSCNVSDDEIINELMNRKKHLVDAKLNKEALDSLRIIIG